MPNSPEDKRKVISGIILAWILSTAFLGLGGLISYKLDLFAARSLYEILALTFMPPALSLAAGIAWAARTRHFKQNIDGSAPSAGSPLDITLRYIQNTAEQTVLFILMVFCCLGAMPAFSQTMLPVLGIWFFIARMMFWVGYRQSPVSRAAGFAATFHPILFFLLISIAAFIL